MDAPTSVNKKQFFFLLYQFMLENRIQEDWFNESKRHKSNSEIYGIRFYVGDDFKTHLMKSIEVYSPYNYDGTIYGFFRFIPSCFDYCYRDSYGNKTKWGLISDKWENKYKHTMLF
jgi:hypothetical protein